MNANVPEVQGPSDELEALALKLAGHQAFAECRGNIRSIQNIFEDLVRKSKTPSEFREKFDVFFGKVRAMGVLLSRLRRDGRMLAYGELWKALTLDDFVLTHEAVPLDKTIPFTILMLEPVKTLVLAKWMACAQTYNLLRFVGKMPRVEAPVPGPGVRTSELFNVFPGLRDRVLKNHERGGDNGAELHAEYSELLGNLEKRLASVAIPLASDHAGPLLFSADGGGSGANFSFPLAFMFVNMKQHEVLGLFSREQQTRVATWQLNIPTLIARGRLDWTNVSLHPEADQPLAQKLMPSFTSVGVSHGYGAVMLTHSSGDNARKRYGSERIIPLGHLFDYVSDGAEEGDVPRIVLVPHADRSVFDAARESIGI